MRMAGAILALVIIIAVVGISALFFAPQISLSMVQSIMRAQAGVDRKEITPPGGSRLVYLEGGKGEPLMLLHGFGADKDSFTLVAAYLTKRFRVIIPDIAGFGESEHPADADYSPPEQARRLRVFAHALGCPQLHLGGNSMGGHIAATYAAFYPEEVKSLWLIDTGGVWSAPKTVLQKSIAVSGHNPLLVRDENDMARLIQLATANPPYIPGPILAAMAKQRMKNYALEQKISQEIMNDSIEKRISGLELPTLIMWGSEDRILSVETAEVLNRLMPRSQVAIIQNTGHIPMLENPAQCALVYLGFRASLH